MRYPIPARGLTAAVPWLLACGLLLACLGTQLCAQESADKPSEETSSDAAFVLVIHADNPIEEMDRSRISKMFLKKIKRWPDKDNTSVEPADQIEKAPVREEFTRAIHNKDIFAVKTYWQRMIFSGRLSPAPELSNDQEVLRFVRSRRGGIGYVRRGTDLGEGAKELRVIYDE